MGIAVQTYPKGSLAGADEPLPAIGERTGAAVVVRIAREGTVEVWTASSGSNETLSAPGDDGARLLALAASELVRARLLGIEPPPPPPAPPPATPADGAPAPREEESAAAAPAVGVAGEVRPVRDGQKAPRLTTELGPAVVAGGLSMAPTVNVFAGAALVVVGPLAIDLFGVTPLVRATTSSGAGEMRVQTALAGGGLRLGWSPGSGRVRLYGAPGFAALFLLLDADAASGYEARKETVAAAAPLLRAGASIAVAKRLRLDLAALVGCTLSEVTVRMGGREAARFGRPLLGGALNLEVILW